MVNKITNDEEASAGAILILIPFIITVILVSVQIPIEPAEAEDNLYGIELYLPKDYADMTVAERTAYLEDLHGGTGHDEIRWWELGWDWTPLYNEYKVFPDGFEMPIEEWLDFTEGRADDVDVFGVAWSCLTLDPPILQELEIWGQIFRIILISSVAIGLLELIWIG